MTFYYTTTDLELCSHVTKCEFKKINSRWRTAAVLKSSFLGISLLWSELRKNANVVQDHSRSSKLVVFESPTRLPTETMFQYSIVSKR